MAGVPKGDLLAKVADGCSGKTLPPNGSCLVQVQFRPTIQIARSATLSVADNASDSPQVAAMASLGTLTPPLPAGVSTPNPLPHSRNAAPRLATSGVDAPRAS